MHKAIRRRVGKGVRKGLHALGLDLVKWPFHSLKHNHLQVLFAEYGINCVLDVGAHYGEFGQYVRHVVGYQGQLISFEPVSGSFARLQSLCTSDPHWSVYQLGLGSEPAHKEINVTQSTDYSSMLRPRQDVPILRDNMTVVTRERIELVRLDDFLKATPAHADPPRIFLKLDTQGWDLEVIEGATESLDNVWALQTEMSVKPIYEGMPHYLDALQVFESKGFELTGFFPVTRDKNHSVTEFDCVLINGRRAQGQL